MGRNASDDDGWANSAAVSWTPMRAPLHEILSAAEDDGSLAPGDRDLAVAQLAGPVVLARIIGLRPYTPEDVERLVDDFLRARLPEVDG